MLGQGRSLPLPDGAIEHLAARYKVHPADLQAIANVESRGDAWFADGRIKILYERHIFYRELPASKRARAVREGLANKGHRGKAQYADQTSAESRYRLLARAIEIDRNAAFRSISSGMFQIMGFNAGTCGYASAEAMFDAFVDSELAQMEAFAAFLEKNKLIPAIRARDFNRVGRVYNGDKTGKYGARMRAEATKLRKRSWRSAADLPPLDRDAGPARGKPAGKHADPHGLALGARGENVRILQEALTILGYPVGDVDGIFGSLTRTGLLEFQSNNDLDLTGRLDAATIRQLGRSPRRAMEIGRATETEDSLAKRGSKTIKFARRGRLAGIFSSVLGGLGFLGQGLDAFGGLGNAMGNLANALPGEGPSMLAAPILKLLPAILGTGASGMWVPMLGIGLFTYLTSDKIAKARVDDHRSGVHRGR